jgi:site-specific DNA-methyltransferase (adenine-specific)
MIQPNSIYNENCLATLKNTPDDFIDLVITSPPYDNLRDYKGYSFDFENIAKELYRTVKSGGVIVWIVNDATVDGSETLTSFKQALYFKEIGFNIHDTMIYMKDNPPPVGGTNRYYQAFEYNFIISKGSPKTFNPIVEPRRNKWNDKRTVRTRPITRNKAGVFTEKEVKVNDQVKLQNVWSYVVSGGSVAEEMIAHEHPAIFPESLCRDHMISWSNEEDWVYDPFMGSGTTAKVALSLNRVYFGSEISNEYCKLIERRLSESVRKT